ncbi:MAG: phospholipase D family protein, partial [Kingella sp. (in: b-proteobacteria)]
EMGLVIYHEGLAKSMQQQLQQSTDHNAYRVVLDDSGKLNWQDKTEPTAFKHEPKATLWKRFWVKILSLLPIERLL